MRDVDKEIFLSLLKLAQVCDDFSYFTFSEEVLIGRHRVGASSFMS